jgi:sensor histidine kinase YesM
MLFSIRYKLLICFFLLILLLSSVGVFSYQSSQQVVSKYDRGFESFLLLNQTAQQTIMVAEKLQAYFIRKEPEYLDEYHTETENLLDIKTSLSSMKRTDNEFVIQSYQNMIDSFVEQNEASIQSFQSQEISAHYSHLHESAKISGFIQESTLSLLNKELKNYEAFYHDLEEQNQLFKKMVIPLFLSTFILSSLFALWISGGITSPIRKLSQAAEEIAKGHLEGREVPVTTNDELRPLTETFNGMRTSICDLITEIKAKSEMDQLLKEFELRSLQNQINPHFLFNTLNTVSKMAYLEDAEETSRLIEAIAALLRYNLGDLNKASTLGDEVKIVKDYFYIQQTRFGDRIHFLTDIEEECLQQKMPPLILQPLIENAFIHGVEDYEENGFISLSVHAEDEHVRIEISDNGSGMDETVKQKLTAFINGENAHDSLHPKSSNGHSTGIGVRNVIKRLQLFYQTKDIMEIHSEPNHGTTFKILVPVEKGAAQLAYNISSG